MAHEATLEFFMLDDTKGTREMLFGQGKDSVSIKEHTKEFLNIFKKFFQEVLAAIPPPEKKVVPKKEAPAKAA